MKLSEYLKKPIEERTSHLEKSEPHLLHPVEGRTLKVRPLREQMSETFGITEWDANSSMVHICHRCSEPNCRSIFHTYIGTAKENFSDRVLEKSYRGEGSHYNNGFYSIKWEEGMPTLPKDFVKGRLEKASKKVSCTRLKLGIKNATDGEINLQVKTKLGETLPEGFWWGYSLKTQRVTCPHCGLNGGKSNMVRYHFDNCKHRSKQIDDD